MTEINVEEVTRHYLICALWAETDNSRPDGGDPLDDKYGVEDFTAEALARAREDCQKFCDENKATLLSVLTTRTGYPETYIGHDLWLNRNGHGAGFWDRGLGKAGDTLSDAARAMGESDVYVGDDGRLHLT